MMGPVETGQMLARFGATFGVFVHAEAMRAGFLRRNIRVRRCKRRVIALVNPTPLMRTIRNYYCAAAILRYYRVAGFLLLLLWNPDFKPMAPSKPIGFFFAAFVAIIARDHGLRRSSGLPGRRPGVPACAAGVRSSLRSRRQSGHEARNPSCPGRRGYCRPWNTSPSIHADIPMNPT